MADLSTLSKPDLVEIIERIAAEIKNQKDFLSKLDTEIGDGDHGFSMATGFGSVVKKLTGFTDLPIGGMLKKIGFELINTIGGAAGAIFGTLFIGQASYYETHLPGKEHLSLEDLSKMFREALSQVKRRGGAKPGDKTMVDALEPAVISLEESHREGISLKAAFINAATLARSGAENTKSMVAKHGRAKNLGERALGYVDPGAVSTAVFFEVIRDFLLEDNP